MPTPQESLENAKREADRAKKKAAFTRVAKAEVHKKTPEELALWQWEHGPDSPQFILAEYEWKRRLLRSQLWWTLLCVLIGAVIGATTTIIGGLKNSAQPVTPQSLSPTESVAPKTNPASTNPLPPVSNPTNSTLIPKTTH